MGGQLLAIITSCAAKGVRNTIPTRKRTKQQVPPTFARPQSLQGGLVAQSVLAVLHDKGKASIDALLSLLL